MGQSKNVEKKKLPISYWSKEKCSCPICQKHFEREIMRSGNGRMIAGGLTEELHRIFEPSAKYGRVYPLIYEIGVSKQAKLELSEKYRAYRYVKGVETGEMRLDETTMAVMQLESGKNEEVINYRGAAHGATIYVDGASRGNPGAAGIGYRVVAEDGRELMRGNEFVGFATSRVAEYYALKKGCEVAIELGLKSVRFVSDSLMVVNQMNGVYKVKNHDLFRIYRDIRRLLKNFEACAFIHVKREQNKEADAEANQAINEHGVFGTKV